MNINELQHFLNPLNTDSGKSPIATPLQPLPEDLISLENPGSAPHTSEILAALVRQMQHHDRQKYTTPPHQYDHYTAGSQQIIHVVHDERTPLTDTEKDTSLKNQARHALMVRKLSLIAGVVNALPYGLGETDDPAIQQKLAWKLYRLACSLESDEDADINYKREIDRFSSDLAGLIAHATGKTVEEAFDELLEVEQLFVADYEKQKILVAETLRKDDHQQDERIIQADIPWHNQLTLEQKKEFQKIRLDEENQPLWFRQMGRVRQRWLLEHIPLPNDPDWEAFSQHFQSSAMTDIPGIHNARTSYLFYNDKQISCSFKTASLVPIGMRDKTEREEMTTECYHQVLQHLQNINPTPGNKPLFVGSIVSKITRLDKIIQEGQAETARWIRENADYTSTLFSSNTPVNMGRHFERVMEGQWTSETESLFQAIQDPNNNYETNKLTEETITCLTTLRESKSNISGRNWHAFKAAYMAILIESMNGSVSTNCKSGKDRTGLDEIYRHAMLIYWHKYKNKKLPRIDDEGNDRENFIRLFQSLFNSRKTQEAAAMNTPGSFGLKDSFMTNYSNVLDSDIAQHLGDTYKASNRISQMNKPSRRKIQDEPYQSFPMTQTAAARHIDALLHGVHSSHGGLLGHPAPENLTLQDLSSGNRVIMNQITAPSPKTLFFQTGREAKFISIHTLENQKLRSEFHYDPSQLSRIDPGEIDRIAILEVESFRARCSSVHPTLRLYGETMDRNLALSIVNYCNSKGYPIIVDPKNTPPLDTELINKKARQIDPFSSTPGLTPKNK